MPYVYVDQSRESWPSMFANQNDLALLGQVRESWPYSEQKRRVNVESRPRRVNRNAMARLGQPRDNWPSMAPVDHVELTKMQNLLESKNKN